MPTLDVARGDTHSRAGMTENEKARADARMDAALSQSGFEDPRPLLRDRLRLFREEQPNTFRTALEYYEQTLLPSLATQPSAPLTEWIEYGRRLGELAGHGKVVSIDQTGRTRPYSGEPLPDHLILHVPNDTVVEVLPLAVPRALSAPQRATLDLLLHRARGRREEREGETETGTGTGRVP